MNDQIRERLSAYLDGALSPAERTQLEAELRASSDMARELEGLRGVSAAIKSLPIEPLPPGFMSRFQSRRAQAPRPEWVFLPPAARPVAFALSCAVVALVVWDKTVTPPENEIIHAPNAARLADMNSAPVSQLDLAAGSPGAQADALGIAGAASEPARRGDTAPLIADKPSLPTPSNGTSKNAPLATRRAAGAPLADAGAGASPLAMTEEARSERNAEMFGYLEVQKKKLGIARVIAKDDVPPVSDGSLFARPSPPKINAPAPILLKQAAQRSSPTRQSLEAAPAASQDAARPSPDSGLVFTDARSLASSWVLLGFVGDPPSVDFSAHRAVLIKPSATKIVSVTPKTGSIDVVFRSLSPEETADPARDRAALIPLEPRAVLLFDVTPR